MPTWDPATYLQFAGERTRPCVELVSRIVHDEVYHAADLGCGPGNSTAVLKQRFPEADLVGVDNSPGMLDQARADHPGTPFVLSDIADWQPQTPCDVILANASLQWLPDHATLFPRLMSMLDFGGVLAVQMPDNYHEPSHTLMDTVAGAGPWAGSVARRRTPPVHEPSFYYEAVAPFAFSIDIWHTRYVQVMQDHAAIVQWTRGTGLRPYLDQIPESHHQAFLAEYSRLLAEAYPAQTDGRVLFPFRRLFIVATAR